MKWTKKKKLKIYKTALESIENYHERWICIAIDSACKYIYELRPIFPNEKFFDIFSELLTFKPADKCIGETWWDTRDFQTRINVLKKCIEMVENQKEILWKQFL